MTTHEFAPPVLNHPSLEGEAFTLQVQRGEEEAFGVRVNTFFGPRYLRLVRYQDRDNNERWCCYPNNRDPHDTTASHSTTAQLAFEGCMRNLSV